MPECRAPPRRIRAGTRIGLGRGGRCGRWRSWPIPGTRAAGMEPAAHRHRSGRPATLPWGISRCSVEPPEGWVISNHPAHPALVSEADFIAAQDTTLPAARPRSTHRCCAGTCWPGCIACGRCGRRLESAWSNGGAAYRCRHGYTSATAPDPGRPKNTYVREDQLLPHLPALASCSPRPRCAAIRTVPEPCQHTRRAQAADLIDQLRISRAVLTYNPDTRTVCADGSAPAERHHRRETTDKAKNGQRGKEEARNTRAPAAAGGRARVTMLHARKQQAMGI